MPTSLSVKYGYSHRHESETFSNLPCAIFQIDLRKNPAMLRYIKTTAAMITIISLFFASSCKKNGNPINDSNCTPFSGITKTDTFGVIIEDDTTDWQPRWDFRWVPMGGNPTDHILFALPAFPNPVGRDSISYGFDERRLGCNIRFAIVHASYVEARVYDKPDRCITTLVAETLSAGYYTILWELRDSLHQSVPEGIYRVIIAAQNEQTHGDIQVLR